MMKNHGVFLVFLILVCLFIKNGHGYPKKKTHNKHVERQPAFIPGMCKVNEMLYPEGSEEWLCDCAPGFVLYPPKDQCFPIYRKGPCAEGNYLVLLPGKKVAECIENPCEKDQFVQFKGLCHKLTTPGGPCGPVNQNGGVLGVDINTLKLDCLKAVGEDGNFMTMFVVPKRNLTCPPGSKRVGKGKCREIA